MKIYSSSQRDSVCKKAQSARSRVTRHLCVYGLRNLFRPGLDAVALCISYFSDICRVCRMEEVSTDRPLFYPCVCTGSIKYVHQEWSVPKFLVILRHVSCLLSILVYCNGWSTAKKSTANSAITNTSSSPVRHQYYVRLLLWKFICRFSLSSGYANSSSGQGFVEWRWKKCS